MAKPQLDRASLTAAEKLGRMDTLWSSLQRDELALRTEQLAEVDRCVERLARDGPVGTAGEQVRAQLSPDRRGLMVGAHAKTDAVGVSHSPKTRR